MFNPAKLNVVAAAEGVLSFPTVINRRYRSMSFTSDLIRIKQHTQIPRQLKGCHVPAVRPQISPMPDCTEFPLK